MLQLRRPGFTIVELMIVVVVVGILAGIVAVSYSGMQQRARDTQRLVDAKHIVQALEVYRAKYGQYPTQQGAPGAWETTVAYPTTFLNSLVTTQVVEKVPIDPKNSTSYHYRYYRYAAGTSGCPVNRGAFFVLQIRAGESGELKKASPGHTCPSRNWTAEFPNGYTVVGFENG